MASVTSQTFTFMPATTRPPGSQKAMNSRLGGVAAEDDAVPLRA